MNNGHSTYFQLMSAGNHLATVSVRPVIISGLTDTTTFAYEVRYADKAPERGTIVSPSDTEELQLVSQVLQSYFAAHSHDNVRS
jgi:hypothetical protein